MTFDDLPETKKALLSHVFDPQNETSLWNYLPQPYNYQLLEVVSQNEDTLLEIFPDEMLLLKYLRAHKAYEPSVNDQRLRHLLWLEYENSFMENRKISIRNVHSLVCNDKSFKALFLKLPYRALFFCCRPASYQHVIKEMLNHGMGRLRQILDMPDVDSKGKPDLKMLALKVKITAMMDMRIHGAPTQKIHQVTQNLIGNTPVPKGEDVKDLVNKGDMATIQQRIKQIEHEKRKLEGRTATIDVTPEPAIPVPSDK